LPSDVLPTPGGTTNDTYYLAGFVTSVPTQKPDFSTSQKSAVDLDGGVLLPGDQLEYTIVVTNTGNDTSAGTSVTDPLPAGVTFVPGSLQISAGMAELGRDDDATSLFRRVDQALYRAKRAGKGRVMAADEPEESSEAT